MSEAAHPDFERLLRQALSPVDPPEDVATRVESTLQNLTDFAVDELESWELVAMRDPRNWTRAARPIAAGVVGAGAGTALVILRVRQQRSRRRAAAANPVDLLGRTLSAAVGEARKLARLD